MYQDRFDIVEAHLLAYMHCHGGASRASDALADANFNAPAKADATGRQWRLAGFAAHAELWRADDAKLMAHGWAVCDPGDEPDHATWSTTTTEAIARQWFAQRVPFF
jgi:hypothetical protein